jgi:hypothetical protein
VVAARRSFAKGKAIFFGPHVGQTVCQMQLGRSVEVDAPGAEDGSARLDDGVLRAEDGASLEIERDRKKAEGSPTAAFLEPHADVVKECWLRLVFEAIEASGKAVAVPWYWPHNAEGAAMLSVDCKIYREDLVHRLQRVLGMYGCRPAWLVSLPGFSLDVYRGLRKWEQEVGLLFTIEEGMTWHEERMKIQQAALSRAAGISDMVAARADEGRWQGWLDFYAMCEGSGARISLSKGGRQPGTSGFLFGTCHPFFPLKRDGSPFLAAELPYLVFMPGIETPIPVAEAVLERAVQANGAYQVTLDLGMKGIEEAVDVVRRLLAVSKQKRMEFMKPGDVYRFEKARRTLKVFLKAADDHGAMTLVSDQEVEGLTLLFSGIPVAARFQGRQASLQTVERFGTKMRALTVSLEARQQLDISLAHAEEDLAA